MNYNLFLLVLVSDFYLIPEVQWCFFYYTARNHHFHKAFTATLENIWFYNVCLITLMPFRGEWCINIKLHQSLKNWIISDTVIYCILCIMNDSTNMKSQRTLDWFLYGRIMHLFLILLQVKTLWIEKLYSLPSMSIDWVKWKVKVLVAQLCPNLCDHMDCSHPLLPMEFSRQEHWTGEGSHSILLGISNPGIEHEELIYNIILISDV